MSNIFDVGIIGMGVAGAFAAFKISKTNKDIKVIGFDIGRPPLKRRRRIEGWLGVFPNSDGKLYQTDFAKVSNITGVRRAKSARTYFKNVLDQIDNFKVVKDRVPNPPVIKKLKKFEYDLVLNDYVQMYPKEIHLLSKYMSETIELNKNVHFCFDSEVFRVVKNKNVFHISTEDQEYRCKKLIIAVGRSGWRWAKNLYNDFGIIENNDIARFGIRIETNSNIMKDFNRSNCSIFKNDIEIGPLSWYGTVIPEDHLDMAISAFRSNENRWKSDKVSFNLIGNRVFSQKGFEQTDRLAKLTFVLSNDRIVKERISTLLADKSKLFLIKEYSWLKDVIMDFSNVIPEIINRAYFHIPTIIPMAPKINLGDNLESEIDGMFIVGESAGISGLLAAGLTGVIAASEVCK